MATGSVQLVQDRYSPPGTSLARAVLDPVDAGGSFLFQWFVDGVPTTDTSGISPWLELVPSLIGKRVSVRVTSIEPDGTTASLSANPVVVRPFSTKGGTLAAGGTAFLGTDADDTVDIKELWSEGGPSRIDGGAGFDTLNARTGFYDAIDADLARGTLVTAGRVITLASIEGLYGGKGSDTLAGDDGPNLLAGTPSDENGGPDRLIGRGGNDTLLAVRGAETIDGGDGNDWLWIKTVRPAHIDLAAPPDGQIGVSEVHSIENVLGGYGNDVLRAATSGSWLDGYTGNDALSGNTGNDVLIGGLGADTLDGGGGFDVVLFGGDTPVRANLADGTALQDGRVDTLRGIRGLVGSTGADEFVGLDGEATVRGELFRGSGGNDTIRGGSGIDEAQFAGPRSAYTVDYDATTGRIVVTDTRTSAFADGSDTLISVERLRFTDSYLLFGERALEVARVSFVLWGAGVAEVPSNHVFAWFISYYDVGYSFEQMVAMQLGHFNDSDAQLAALLVRNTPGTRRTEAELLKLMADAGGGAAGRAAAVSTMAEDPKTYEQVALAGLGTQGIEVRLNPQTRSLFVELPDERVNPALVADPARFTLDEDSTLPGLLTGSAREGELLRYDVLHAPAHGSVVIDTFGSFRYRPADDYHGSDSFTFRVTDGSLYSAPATVLLTVRPVDEPTVRYARVSQFTDIYSGSSYPLLDYLDLADERDLDHTRFSVEWFVDGEAVSNAHFDTGQQVGHRLSALVRYTDASGKTIQLATNSIVVQPFGTRGGSVIEGGTAYRGTDGDDVVRLPSGNGTNGQTDPPLSRYDGGAGFDTVLADTFNSITGEASPIDADLARGTLVANNGASTLVSIEALYGGKGSDTLAGSDGPNWLGGNPSFFGADRLIGRGGNDTLLAGQGTETIEGGDGIDWLWIEASVGGRVDLAGGSFVLRGNTGVITSIENVRGNVAADVIRGAPSGSRLEGGAGDDSLTGGTGNDVLVGGFDDDLLDGAGGFDVALFENDMPVVASLAEGKALQQGDTDTLRGIRGLVGGIGDDQFTGLDGAARVRGELFRGGGGNDTIRGGSGMDEAQYAGPRSAYTVRYDAAADRIVVTDTRIGTIAAPNDGVDTLFGIERLRFADSYVAFGERALEVARVAFVLWGPEAALNTGLLPYFISYYDVGYSFEQMVSVQLAHVGGGTAERAAAVIAMANDAKTYEQVAAAGLTTQGIVMPLDAASGGLFVELPSV